MSLPPRTASTGLPRQTWILGASLSVAAIIGLLLLTSSNKQKDLDQTKAMMSEALYSADSQLAEANSKHRDAVAEAAALKEELAAARAQVEKLQQEKEAVTQAQKSLEQQMRAALDSKDITISELQGKLTVNILDRILFDSGEAVLRSEGEKVLQQIAGILAQYPKRQVHVIGHTDNVPIRSGAKGRFASNWELSTARAIAAVRYLQDRAGVDPTRLGAVGYGEYHPVADNATAEGRAKNRRIALVVLPEELVGSDAPAAPRGAPAPVKE
jgi:chemotaxis protein MotB